MTDSANRPLPVQFQVEHPGWVRELAFSCWVAADRNASRAVQLLEERWPEGEEHRPVPYRTLAGWAQRDGWDAKADAAIADTFGGLRVRQIAMLVHANTAHVQTINDIAAGVYADPAQYDQRAVRNMLEAAKVGLMAGGIGTFGSKDRTAPTVKAQVNTDIDFSQMTNEELAELRLKALREARTDHPERKR